MSKSTYQEVAAAIRGLMTEMSPQQVVRQVAAYLIAERRTGELGRIMREVERRQLETDKIVEVTASSTHSLSAELRQEISQLFGDDTKSVRITQELKPELIGGVRIRTLDTVLDLSVRGQLNRLRGSQVEG